MRPGFVYILVNSAMPDLVKIGRTSRDVEIRATELWQTGVPMPFEVYHQFKTPDCVQLEAYLHGALAEYRVSKSREFFRVDPEKAVESGRMWLCIQANDWVDEYFSEIAAVNMAQAVAGIEVSRIAAGMGERTILVSDAIAKLSADDLAPHIVAVKAEREREEREFLKRIGIDGDEVWEPSND